MKKFIYGMFTFVLALVLVPMYADAAEVEVASEADLVACVDVDGNTCKLTANVVLPAVLDVKYTTTIDLNGFSITPADTLVETGGLIYVIHGGALTINDSGENGSISVGTSGNLYAAVQLTKKGNTDITKTATLVVNGGTLEGYYYAVVGNGSQDRGNTSITINGGVLKATNTTANYGIYHPQDGKLTVNGGEITGLTGIEMRSGTLVVNGGTITGTGVPVSVNPNGSGSTTIGAGIAVAQHTSENNISVTINGGTIKGHSALYESNPEGNENIENTVTMSVTGGNFVATNGGTNAIYSSDVKNFVSGGTFSSDLTSDYLVDTVTTKEENGVYYVGTEHSVKVNAVTNGKVVANKIEAIVGELVTVTATPNADYEVDKITVVDANGKAVTVNEDGTFTMPDSEVTISVTFKSNENPNTADNILVYFVAGFVSLVAVCGATLKLKKASE